MNVLSCGEENKCKEVSHTFGRPRYNLNRLTVSKKKLKKKDDIMFCPVKGRTSGVKKRKEEKQKLKIDFLSKFDVK